MPAHENQPLNGSNDSQTAHDDLHRQVTDTHASTSDYFNQQFNQRKKKLRIEKEQVSISNEWNFSKPVKSQSNLSDCVCISTSQEKNVNIFEYFKSQSLPSKAPEKVSRGRSTANLRLFYQKVHGFQAKCVTPDYKCIKSKRQLDD